MNHRPAVNRTTHLQTAVLVDVVEDLHEYGAVGFRQRHDLQVALVFRHVALPEVVLDPRAKVVAALAEKHLQRRMSCEAGYTLRPCTRQW